MDIFTTVLTRVVPVPIKPANLKVKALLKEAGAGKLKEDLDHLENHDYYFGQQKLGHEQDEPNEQEKSAEKKSPVDTNTNPSKNENHTEADNNGVSVSKDGIKHLDLYV
ncbi:hypothetical protein A9Q74_16400 [Colwellia sp. 39_35_sub15_T18]|nr:hypothetical protein A9Q74_16400 [Colwellia sp. 39_35_sub15_T18]